MVRSPIGGEKESVEGQVLHARRRDVAVALAAASRHDFPWGTSPTMRRHRIGGGSRGWEHMPGQGCGAGAARDGTATPSAVVCVRCLKAAGVIGDLATVSVIGPVTLLQVKKLDSVIVPRERDHAKTECSLRGYGRAINGGWSSFVAAGPW